MKEMERLNHKKKTHLPTYVLKNLDSLTKIRIRLGDWVEGFEKGNNIKYRKELEFWVYLKDCKINLTFTEIL